MQIQGEDEPGEFASLIWQLHLIYVIFEVGKPTLRTAEQMESEVTLQSLD